MLTLNGLQVRPPESGVAKVWLVIPRRDVAVAPLLSGKTDRRHFVLVTPAHATGTLFEHITSNSQLQAHLTFQITHTSPKCFSTKIPPL